MADDQRSSFGQRPKQREPVTLPRPVAWVLVRLRRSRNARTRMPLAVQWHPPLTTRVRSARATAAICRPCNPSYLQTSPRTPQASGVGLPRASASGNPRSPRRGDSGTGVSPVAQRCSAVLRCCSPSRDLTPSPPSPSTLPSPDTRTTHTPTHARPAPSSASSAQSADGCALAVSLRLLDSSPFGPLPFRRRSRLSACIGVHRRMALPFSALRAAYRARHSRALILPLNPPRMPQERFLPARATFFASRHAAAHRDTPPRHAPLSPLPAHPGESAPRTAKARSNSEFIRRLRIGLVLVLANAYLLSMRSG